jgi:NAD-dependent deacetylase
MAELSAKSLMGIRCAVDIILGSNKIVVLTGAGISTPSGIPDFRSPDGGLWSYSDPFEVASLTTFRTNPEKFFSWMRPLTQTILNAQPNSAHTSLARLESVGRIQAVVTQNIDGLHQRAGSKVVYELHGSLETVTCGSCFHKYPAEVHIRDYLESGLIPRCSDCQGVLKPDIIMFGEQLPVQAWLKAQEISRNCDLMIVVGSSLEVLPVASLPMRALEHGARLIIINLSQTYLDVRADVVFHEDLIEILPRVIHEVLDERC